MCLCGLELEDTGFEGEGEGTDDCVCDVEGCCRLRLWYPRKTGVGRRYEYNEYLHRADVPFRIIENRRDDQRSADTDEDKEGNGVRALLLRVAVGDSCLDGNRSSSFDGTGKDAEGDDLEIERGILGQ